MSSRDVFSMAIRNLFKRKLRTSLTVLGVIVGVVCILLMISLGIGINMNFDKQLEGMGDLTLINVYNWDGYNGTPGAPVLDQAMFDKISKLDGVDVVTPVREYWYDFKLVSGRYSAPVYITGIYPQALTSLGFKIAEGTTLSTDTDAYEIVFGLNVPSQFKSDLERKREEASYRSSRSWMPSYFRDDVVDTEPKVNLLMDRITGSYAPEYGTRKPSYPNGKKPDVYNIVGVGILAKSETDTRSLNYCFMDIDKMEKIIKDREKYYKSVYGKSYGSSGTKTYGYEQAYVKCKDVKAVQKVMDTLKDDLGFNEYNLWNPTSWVNEMKKMSESLQLLLAGVGAVALFVAAIGITNTMIMSIYERTREIGIMKVIGAAIKDIRKLFLVEAAMIGLLGGVVGVILSYAGSYAVNHVGIAFFERITYTMGENPTISYIPAWLAGAGLAFAAVIGLISGYFPARRAMRISALTAIKTE